MALFFKKKICYLAHFFKIFSLIFLVYGGEREREGGCAFASSYHKRWRCTSKVPSTHSTNIDRLAS